MIDKAIIHIYSPTESSFDGNGYAIFEPISADVYQERNGEYSVTFEAYPDDYGKWKYIKRQAFVKVPIMYHGELKWQVFRLTYVSRAMQSDGTYRINANGVHLFYENSRFLINSAHPTRLTGAQALPYITSHSIYNPETYPFTCGSNITTYATAYYDNVSITAALLGEDQCFVNRWGGNLYRDNYYFSINGTMENSQDVGVIAYAYNMTDIDFEEDDSEIITDLIALDNFGNKYHARVVDADMTVPKRVYRSVTFQYEVEDVDAFHADADAYLDEYKQSAVNITVNFLNLSDLDKYKQFLSLDAYEVGDRVTVYHKDLGVYYANLEIISKRYDIVRKKTTEIQIGRFKNAINRSSFMSNTVTTGSSVIDKQNAAVSAEIDTLVIAVCKTWGGASAYTWQRLKSLKWGDVKL